MKRSFYLLFLIFLLLLPACQEETQLAPPTLTPTAQPVVHTYPLTAELAQDASLGGHPPQAPLHITFNQPVDILSVSIPLLIDPPANGRFTWSDDRTTLTFTPQTGLRPQRAYTLTLPDELTAVSGQPLANPTQWEITTLGTPRLLSRNPNGVALDDRRPTIQLTFNQAMNRESVAAALTITPNFAHTLAWEENTLLIAAQEALQPGETYRFRLGETAVDQVGTPRSTSPITWNHQPKPLLSSTAVPRASSPNNPITLHFNYKMDPDSVAQALTIHDDNNTPLVGDLTWNDDYTTCTFTPATRLPADTRYLVALNGPIQDANGDPITPFTPFDFVTPPPILSTRPQGNSVNPFDPISVQFDRLMDEAATAAAFVITPTLPGAITWDETTLIFTPDDGQFAEYATYAVTIAPTARGAEGEAILNEPYSFTFTTGALPDTADFGYGPNAQVVDANGRRAVQYTGYGNLGVTVTFDLYQMSLTQFLDRYSSGFRGGSWNNQSPPISTVGTTLVRSWQDEITRSPARYAAIQETFIPDDVPPGLYLLNLTKGHVNDQLILILTAHTVMVKQAEGRLVAWVTDFDGTPVSGIDVAVYARDGELVASGLANASGVFRTNVTRDPQPLIVIARSGSDVTASGLSNEWRTGVNWWGWWRTAPAALDYAAYVYTDRPIYRPGQTVYFKAIVRRDDDAVLDMLPQGTAVSARLRDARNNVVQTIELTTNNYGTVNGEFQVAEGAMLGNYAIELVLDGESHRQSFQVEDYRKPDYAVTVTTDKDVYVTGETIAVDVQAEYFFGEPVADAQTALNLYFLTENYAYGWSESDATPEYIWYQSYQPAQTRRTDENGRITLTTPAQGDSYSNNRVDWRSSVTESIWALEATTDDGSHQTVSGFKLVRVYNAAEIVTLDTNGYFHEPGASFPIVATVKTIAGEPVNGRDLTLTLRRWSSGSYGYETIVQRQPLTTGTDGTATLSFTVEEPGFYQMRVQMSDRLGNAVSYSTYVYAFRDGWTSWYGNDDALTISADRDSYAPGDTAQLLVQSSFSGPALLTFERGTTRREELVQLTAPVTLLNVAIQPDDRPNIHITINAWEPQEGIIEEYTDTSLPDSKLHVASVNLSVPVTDKTLLLTITPDKDVYAPREEATFTVRVTNQDGVPVAAELSLAMVDEAIFSLSDDKSGPIFDAFYFERGNIVRTYDALALSRYLGGGMGGGGGGGDLAGNPRADFPDTAVWFPTLQTNFNGEATVTITLPDSLTSWRLTAKAATADTQVGETFSNITVRQDVVVRPILPRILTAGDEMQLTALVHNYTERTQTIAVELGVGPSQFTIHRSPQTSITIPAGGVRVVGWGATAVAAGNTPITLTARLGDEVVDAVLLPLEIRPLAVPDVTTQVGQFSGELATTVDMPAGALPLSSVRVELARSIAGTLLEGLEYLTGFPYGCVEQTMSRALPNAVVGRAFNQLGVSNPTLQADLPAKINASVQRLYGYQHNDGGWGWWYDDATDDYQTAWVIFGLATVREAGYEVDQGVIDRGVAWLNENLSSMDPRTQAYALYSMAVAGQPNGEAALALLAQAADLDTFSQAGLALALHVAGERDGALDALDLLAETAVATETGLVYWSGDNYDGYYHQKTMSSATRSTALALSAFVQIQPGSALEGGMVRYLMSQRKQHGWGTTNETAYAIIGLTDHLLAASFSESATATQYAVVLNGETVASGSLGRGEPAVSLEIPAAQMRSGTNALRITQSGGGQLYYVVNGRVYLEQAEIAAAGVVEVSRAYTLPNGDPLEEAQPGQLVQVRLTVTMPQDATYVIVEDSLPGGLEALNERLNNTSHAALANEWEDPRYYWQEYGYNYKEVRGDRVSFFITEFGRGTRTFTYMARATHAGAFAALPAEVYAMYDLAVWGRSASSELMVMGE